ncbi:MAG: methyltransferase domain-containing protein [Euryarchaeota archaeon]|nr:methyltransferase domain-containing protein [Euryarchaeota archaeon]
MQSFFDFFGRIEERESVLRELASLLAPGECVLDIATGSGYLARQMKDQRVVCLDLDPGVIHRTARLLPGTYVCADATRLPFRDASFDSAVAWTGAAHIPDWKGLVREMVRVTRAGGRVILAEPKGEYSTRAFRDSRCTHAMPSPAEIAEELDKFGQVELRDREYFVTAVAGL